MSKYRGKPSHVVIMGLVMEKRALEVELGKAQAEIVKLRSTIDLLALQIPKLEPTPELKGPKSMYRLGTR